MLIEKNGVNKPLLSAEWMAAESLRILSRGFGFRPVLYGPDNKPIMIPGRKVGDTVSYKVPRFLRETDG